MKFDQILAQYLYQRKKLNLPGIGTFEADSSVFLPEEKEKQKPSMEGISFQNVAVSMADDDLIEFIKEHTGKMKALAIADLESYLTLGKQFLYIGKPFYLEGIGTLVLTKEGRFEFTPGQYTTTKLEDPNVERSEAKKRSVREENRLEQESTTNTIKKLMLALAILAVLGIAGYGAYYVYRMYAQKQQNALGGTTITTDTSTRNALPEDNGAAIKQNNTGTPAPYESTYTFVVETTDNKLRALNRYYLLKSYGNKIQMLTADSIRFKLFYTLPATVNDTLRLRDSLNRWYYGNTNVIRVKVEH